MLFRPELCEKILAGEKTETRRVVKPNERLVKRRRLSQYDCLPDEVVATDETGFGRLKWQVGRRYAVQPGRGKKGVGFLQLTGIRREPLQEMGENDAIAEGVMPELGEHYLSAFVRLWDGINPHHSWSDNPDVWVLEFRV